MKYFGQISCHKHFLTYLTLFFQTCQQGVVLQPNNSRALCLLGNAQLSRHDNDVNNNTSGKYLEEAEKCFRLSLDLEGKPSGGQLISEAIREQRWWKERESATTASAKNESKATPANTTKASQRTSPTKAATTTKTRGNILVRKN